MQAITVHPTNPDVVYVGTQNGPYRSVDRGERWERLPFPEDGGEVWSILVHPTRPRTLLAGTSPVGIFRSDDDGATWRRLPKAVQTERVKMPFACRVMRMAIDPAQPEHIYAALEVGGAMRSLDGGETWEDGSADLVKLSDLPHLKSRIVSDSEMEGMLDGHALCVSGAASGTVFLALRMGLFRSTDRAAHWRDMEVGRFSPLTYSRDIRVSPQDPRVLYACLSPAARSEDGSLYRSGDLGETWTRFDHGVKAESTMMAVALHPRDAGRVYCASRTGQIGTLDLKMVVHHGPFLRHTVAGRSRVTGTAVILVHRLLKNGVGRKGNPGPRPPPSPQRGEGGGRGEVADEAADVAQVLVALRVRREAGALAVDAQGPQHRLGEERVATLPSDPVLEQPVHQDHRGTGHPVAPRHRVPQERPVVDDHLEIEGADLLARPALALLGGLHHLLPALEGGERLLQHRQQPGVRQCEALAPEGEHRVALDLLDLERGRQVPDHLVEQGGDDVRAVLELGGGHEGGEPGDVGQDQEAVIRSVVHAPETPLRGIRETPGVPAKPAPGCADLGPGR